MNTGGNKAIIASKLVEYVFEKLRHSVEKGTIKR